MMRALNFILNRLFLQSSSIFNIMTYSDTETATNPYEDQKTHISVSDIPKNERYDSMVNDFY